MMKYNYYILDRIMYSKIKKLLIILKNPKLLFSLRFGVAASTESFEMLEVAKKVKTIFDVGSNKGQFSLAARFKLPNAQIYAFEPLKKPFSKLSKIFKNDLRIKLFNYAIGPKNQETSIHISKRDDSSSLLPITKKQSDFFPGTEELRTEKIQMKKIDDVFKNNKFETPCLLKIDVQGFELEVLKNFNSYLNIFEYIYVECSFIELYEGQALIHDVYKFLDDSSFKFYSIYNVHYDEKGGIVQADFLFKKNIS